METTEVENSQTATSPSSPPPPPPPPSPPPLPQPPPSPPQFQPISPRPVASKKTHPRFGKVKFSDDHDRIADYAIVSKDASPQMNYEIITSKWNLTAPSIILSIAGGGDDEFALTSGMTKEFQQGVRKIALQTGGWITTSGTNSGVVQLVGKMVRQNSSANMNSGVIALGVASFGAVDENEKFYQNSFAEGEDFEEYTEYECNNANGLEKNHTHFLLMEEGLRYIFGSDDEKRASLESLISKKIGEPQKRKTPLLSLLINGGLESLKAVHSALKKKSPVIVVAESKGCARILSNLYNKSHKAVTERKMVDLLADEGIEYSKADLNSWTKLTTECIKMKKHMTIFFTDQNGSFGELDQAVLQALKVEGEVSTEQLLKLSMEWNRCYFAKNHILTEEADIINEDLWLYFKQALQEDRTDFIEMFLDWKVQFLDCMTLSDLQNLYTNCVKAHTPLYELMVRKEWAHDRAFKSLIKVKDKQSVQLEKSSDAIAYLWALRELFKWAVLLNRRTTSRILWDAMSEDQLPAAIVASSMLTQMANQSMQAEWKNEYNDHAEIYRNLANGILTKCFEHDAERTASSLTRKLCNWGNKTCLQLALECTDFDTMAHAAVQWHLANTWLRGMVKPNNDGFHAEILFWIKIIVCFVLPILIPLFLKFEDSSEKIGSSFIAPKLGRLFVTNVFPVTTESDFEANNNQENVNVEGGKRNAKSFRKGLSAVEKMHAFYQVPLVKFVMHVLFYVIFLLFYAYNILFAFYSGCGSHCTISRWLLFAWILTIGAEEIHDIHYTKSNVYWKKILIWIRQPENELDVIAFLLFIPGFFLRNVSSYTARALLVPSFCIYTMRFFNLFRVNGDLGPKLMMVVKMIKDLAFFLFIWLIFLFAYGVSSQALLYPNEVDVGRVIQGIISKPYWHIYGELFLEEVNYDPDDGQYNCGPSTDRECPTQTLFVPILLGIYMMLVSVLLLNFLIATFTYTFDKLISKTDVIWEFQQYQLVEEYYHHPCLVAPLNIVNYVYRILAWIARSTCNGCKNAATKDSAFKKTITGNQLEKLVYWEQSRTRDYLENERLKTEASVSYRLDKLVSTLQTIQAKMKYQGKISSVKKVL
ncbi:transient receptor potential cation channel subfamily M member 2-like [Clavelina lepadiformis]|uniref:transient receptor potential cation channel subfamily M member 2-like n=1 Tax=Clavelina lepadiformis TaxID=159417 RepID=UPI0040412033